MGQADELQDRLISFAAQMIRLSASLPKTYAGRHIAGQILRSGTSPAPNYGEARGAESHADFIHKLGIVLKELNETATCSRLLRGVRLHVPDHLRKHSMNATNWPGSSMLLCTPPAPEQQNDQ